MEAKLPGQAHADVLVDSPTLQVIKKLRHLSDSDPGNPALEGKPPKLSAIQRTGDR